jgi:hypothetical protein
MSDRKTQDVPVALRMPAPMVLELRRVAKANERSLSQELRLAARKHLHDVSPEGSAAA